MTKRAVRQRVWAGAAQDEKASSRQVGENLRNVDSALLRQVPLRPVTWSQRVYSADGLPFESASRPLGAIVVSVERADGSWQAVSAVPELKMIGGTTVVAKIDGLTPGERYAVIRMLVVG